MTDKEMIDLLKSHADHYGIINGTASRDEFPTSAQRMAFDCLAAAERIRVLGEEVEVHRWKVDPGHDEEVDRAVAATDAARGGAT